MLPHPLLIEVDELLILGKAVCMCRIDKHERSGILAAGLHVYGKFCGCRRLGLDVFRRGSLHAVRAIRTAYPAVSAARGYHPQADAIITTVRVIRTAKPALPLSPFRFDIVAFLSQVHFFARSIRSGGILCPKANGTVPQQLRHDPGKLSRSV